MPRIFDNIETSLLPALQSSLEVAERADFCVGYFNLRGWRNISDYVDRWHGGLGNCCLLLVGMHVNPTDELRQVLRYQQDGDEESIDNQSAIRAKRNIAEEFRINRCAIWVARPMFYAAWERIYMRTNFSTGGPAWIDNTHIVQACEGGFVNAKAL